MSKAAFTEPHGGELINLFADDERCQTLKELAMNLKDVILDEWRLCDFELFGPQG